MNRLDRAHSQRLLLWLAFAAALLALAHALCTSPALAGEAGVQPASQPAAFADMQQPEEGDETPGAGDAAAGDVPAGSPVDPLGSEYSGADPADVPSGGSTAVEGDTLPATEPATNNTALYLDGPTHTLRLSFLTSAAESAAPVGVLTSPSGTVVASTNLAALGEGMFEALFPLGQFACEQGVYRADVTTADGVVLATVECSVSANDEYSAVVSSSGSSVVFTATGDHALWASSVQAAVSGSDPNDAHTFPLTRQEDGTWQASSESKLLGPGTYHAVFELSVGGDTVVSSPVAFEIPEPSADAEVTYDPETGDFSIDVDNVTHPAPITGAQVLVSGPNGSTSVYDLEQGEDGAWTASTNVSAYDWKAGLYEFKVILRSEIWSLAASNPIEVVPSLTDTAYVGKLASRNTLDLWVGGGMADMATHMEFRIVDPQGVTHIATTQRDHSGWYTRYNTTNLPRGMCYADAYATINGLQQHVGRYEFQLFTSSEYAMWNRIKNYSSPTSYLLAVDSSSCVTGVFTGSAGNWRLLYFWSCSPGARSTPTVTGVFSVGEKGYYFVSYGSWCYYYTQFYGDYLFHSTTYNANGSVQDGRLGLNLSHGCVRLNINNAKWIYDNIPRGTTVVSYR